jgi:hypothetical protein
MVRNVREDILIGSRARHSSMLKSFNIIEAGTLGYGEHHPTGAAAST